MTDEERQAYMEEDRKLCHAIQSGVQTKMSIQEARGSTRNADTSPKNLRVGINVALCDQSAVVRLLITKGIIDEKEYWEAVLAVKREEVERYQRDVAKMMDTKSIITLR